MVSKNDFDIVIIGSGPSGVAAALALSESGARSAGLRVLLIDRALALPDDFPNSVVSSVGVSHPTARCINKARIPRKRHFAGIELPLDRNGNYSLTAPALGPGGLSLLWGSNVFPFLAEDIKSWPIGLETLSSGYEAISRCVPITYNPAYAAPFQFATGRRRTISSSANALLAHLQDNSTQLEEAGIKFGVSALLLHDQSSQGETCTMCQQCLTGCPLDLIYSTRHSLEAIRRQEIIETLLGVELLRFRELSSGVELTVVTAGGELSKITTSKLLLGAGPIETARILIRSIPELLPKRIEIKDSGYFLLPILFDSFNTEAESDSGQALSQLFLRTKTEPLVHALVYGSNPLIWEALPGILALFPWLRRQLHRRLGVLQGYLNSDVSGVLVIENESDSSLVVKRAESINLQEAVRNYTSLLWKNRKKLGFKPLLPLVSIPPVGSGFHFGASFPMSVESGLGTTDLSGRLHGLSSVHLIDSSNFPTMPATNPTFTIMANAHRIATELLERCA